MPELSSRFIRQICQRDGIENVEMTSDAVKLLASYQWPGNVRELQNICERAVVLCGVHRSSGGDSRQSSRELIEPWLIPPRVLARPVNPPLSPMRVPERNDAIYEPKVSMTSGRKLADIERDAIVEALQRYSGHRQKTAEALGIGVRTLGLKLKKWKEDNLVAQTL